MLAGAIGGNVRGEELARRLSIFRCRLLVDTAGEMMVWGWWGRSDG